MQSRDEQAIDRKASVETVLLDPPEVDDNSNLRPSRDEQSVEMDELAASIQEHGTLLQPIGVFRQGERYRLLFGGRRLQATRLHGATVC